MNGVALKLSGMVRHFRQWREWELNPVVVKELRQAVRNWSVTGMLLLFLVVLFFASIAFLVGQSFQVVLNQRIGAEIFQAFLGILAGASLAFIPLYVGIRMAAERHGANLDLVYITTLTPGRIIRGKLFCGIYIALLFFSACMPFMAFTNLLRGVDLPTIFFILLFLFFVVGIAIQVAIFVACLPMSLSFKVLLALPVTGGIISLVGPVVFASFELMRSGVGAMMASRDFWSVVVTVGTLGLAGMGLFYFLSVAMISPVSANRGLPLKAYVTFLWLIGGVVSCYWVWREKECHFILPWAMISFVLMAGALILVISNHDQLSLRVQRAIPASRLAQAWAFLFYNGAAGGLVWVFLITGTTFALSTTLMASGPEWFPGFRSFRGGEFEEFFVLTAASVAYALAYGLTALFLHRTFLKKKPPKLAGVLAILLPGIWTVAPNLVLFFVNRLSWEAVEKMQWGNVFNAFVVRDQHHRIEHVIFAAAWVVVMLLLNARWFVLQARAFQPLGPRNRAARPSELTTNSPP